MRNGAWVTITMRLFTAPSRARSSAASLSRAAGCEPGRPVARLGGRRVVPRNHYPSNCLLRDVEQLARAGLRRTQHLATLGANASAIGGSVAR